MTDRRGAPETVRFEFTGARPEGAVRDLGGVYGGSGWVAQSTAGRFDYRYTALGDADVTIRRAQLHGSMRGSVPAGGDHVVVLAVAGTGEVERLGRRRSLPIGTPVLLSADDDYTFWTSDHDHRLVHLDPAFVRDVATARTEADEPRRSDDRHADDVETTRRWEGVLVALARALRIGGPESPAWNSAKVLAAEAFLSASPPHAEELPAVLALHRNARLRAAVQYIYDHAAEPVTITELSAASGLSVRSVQESFRRVFDVSPLTYLRHVRLDRVRAELLELDPQVGAVGDVAKRWGFAHLGRFSASYAERFGEYPKQTLRR